MTVPLRLLMALTISVVAAVTAIVCFAPTYISGVDSVLSAVGNIRSNLVTLAAERLTAYFAKPRDLALLLQYTSARGRLDAGNSSAMVQLSCDLVVANMNSFLSLTLLMISENMFLLCDTSNVITRQYTGLPSVIVGDNTMIQAFTMDNTTHLPIPGSEHFRATFPAGTPLWAISPITVAFQMNPTLNTVWAPPVLSWDRVSLQVGSRLRYPNGTFRGAAVFDVSSVSVAPFLRTLGLREMGRAIAWDDGTGLAVGLSWDESPVHLYPNWQDQTLSSADRGRLRPLDNFSDPLLRRVLSALTGFQALRSLALPFSGTVGSGRQLVYVDVVGVRDAFGLNIKVLLAMPQLDFLRDVYKQQVRTLAGVAAGVIAMIGLAFAIGHIIAAPLRRLAFRMELTASFNDNEEDDPQSLLAEVASMQASYSLMKGQLNRAKTYLPQSVLAAANAGDDDEGPVAWIKSPSTSGRRSDNANGSTHSSLAHAPLPSGTIAGGLNVDLGLSLRCVSVVAFNLQGFMRCAASSSQRCAELQQAMLEALQRAVRENKGVIDYFQGDRVLASFNAVTSTAAHGRRAVLATLSAIRELRTRAEMPLRASAGISSGMALCGNMGTTEMRRFCVVGHAVVQALTLERLTKVYKGVSALMPGWMETDALEMYYQVVGIVRLPGGGPKLDSTGNRHSCLLLAPMAVKTVAQDEWMYELKSGDDASPFRHVNSGFHALLAGDVSGAKTALAARTPDSVIDALGARTLTDSIARAESAADAKAMPADFGLFYECAFAPAPAPSVDTADFQEPVESHPARPQNTHE